MSDYPPIQVVDSEDKPIRGAGMYEAYDGGLIHRIVFIWVVNTDGKILLQRRSPNVENHPNTWDVSAAGHVDVGETYEEAASRELKEELGITGFDLVELGYFYHEITVNNRLLKRFNKVYKVVVPTNIVVRPDPDEVTEVKWLAIKGIKELIAKEPDEVASGLIVSLTSYENNLY